MKTKRLNSILSSLPKLGGMKRMVISAIAIVYAASVNLAFADDAGATDESNNNLEPKKELVVKREANKSYLIPAAEIVGFDFL